MKTNPCRFCGGAPSRFDNFLYCKLCGWEATRVCGNMVDGSIRVWNHDNPESARRRAKVGDEIYWRECGAGTAYTVAHRDRNNVLVAGD